MDRPSAPISLVLNGTHSDVETQIGDLQVALSFLDGADAADSLGASELGRRDAQLLLGSVEEMLETLQPTPEEWRRIDVLAIMLRYRLSSAH